MEEQSTKILEALNELKRELPAQYVAKEVYNARLLGLEGRVKELEKSKDTAFWAIVAAMGSALLTLVRMALGH